MTTFYKIDDHAAAVRAIQERLRALARNDRRLSDIYIDGIYGSETEAAVRIFQETRGLPVTGTVDYLTHRMITEEYALMLLRNERLIGSPDFDRYKNGIIAKGDCFDGVLALQLLFRSIAEQDDRFQLAADGIYGDSTAEAVSLFKKLRGIEGADDVDRLFWNELAAFAERYGEN